MILVCGATGMLGRQIVTKLVERGQPVRALVRPGSEATGLEAQGVDIVRGDLRERGSLRSAVAGVVSIVSTANTIARVLGGDSTLTIRDVDDRGYAALIEEADAAGVERFVFISFLQQILDSGTPFAKAKLVTEQRLRDSTMREVVVRSDMFQEIWLSSLVQFDWPAGKVTIFGKGDAKHRYVATDDVAEAMVRLLMADDPPRLMEFGGPEALTRREAVETFERELGRPIKRRHVPRPALALGSRLLRPVKPVLASVMGQALAADRQDSRSTDAPLRQLGIEPRTTKDYIRQVATEHRQGVTG
ncbi:MAG: NmrA family NAD(P)-binding protein [Chloroflexota bacterium]|nr:NmrA family NAD(P)-binding protein [Chloroflexota bacterium]